MNIRKTLTKMEHADITIIGAGVIGLALAHTLSRSGGRDMFVIEKETSFGRGTSSRNSEVIHAGIYYPSSSLKSETCIRGRHLIYETCAKHALPHRKTGKLIIARNAEELVSIRSLYQNALFAGVENIELLEKNDVRTLEPEIECCGALLSPETGILDSHAFMSFLKGSAAANGVDFTFGVTAEEIERTGHGYIVSVREPSGEIFVFETRVVINAAGLFSDKIAELAGFDTAALGYKLRYSKGQYFRITDPKKFNIKKLIYPPPSKQDLGIHTTPDLAGGLRLGPDSNDAEDIEYSVNPMDAGKFFASARSFIPKLEPGDIAPESAGIRPKLAHSGASGFNDFIIENEAGKGFPGFINLIGIESPGLTASLAIAEKVSGMLS